MGTKWFRHSSGRLGDSIMTTKNTVTADQINQIIADSTIEVSKWEDKTTIVKAKLPNGFIIIESSSCVDPANFDEVVGYEICMERIANKIWELEGYSLQNRIYMNKKAMRELGLH